MLNVTDGMMFLEVRLGGSLMGRSCIHASTSSGRLMLGAKEAGFAVRIELVIKAWRGMVNSCRLIPFKFPAIGLRYIRCAGLCAHRTLQINFPTIASGHDFLLLIYKYVPILEKEQGPLLSVRWRS
jgi:hypothetical protein